MTLSVKNILMIIRKINVWLDTFSDFYFEKQKIILISI